jgi:hypothetical protein
MAELFDLEILKNLKDFLIAGTSAVIGAIFKGLWDRHRDRTMSTQDLLERLEKQRLSKYGRNRLSKEAAAALADWRRAAAPPPASHISLKKWPEQPTAIVALHYNQPPESSRCPGGPSENPETPLFIRLVKAEQPIQQLQLGLTELADSVPNSKKLIQQLKSDYSAYLWISASSILVRTASEANSLLDELTSNARKWIPGVSVILEIYIAHQIVSKINHGFHGRVLPPPDQPKQSIPSLYDHSCRAASYAYCRDEISDVIQREGAMFGHLDIPEEQYTIPEEVLLSRLPPSILELSLESSYWTLSITGPPGSGKSETADLIVRRLRYNSNPIVLIASSSPAMMTALIEVTSKSTRKDIIEQLGEVATVDESLIPDQLKMGSDWQYALKDVFIDSLFYRSQNIVIVIDDLQLHREVLSAINKLAEWEFRLILISRPEIQLSKQVNKRSMLLVCNPWSREEAEKLLKKWVSQSQHQRITNALRQGWLKNQHQFSLYLLRTLTEYVEHIEAKPTDLLRRAIEAHLSSLSTIPTDSGSLSPTVLLGRIRRLLEEGESPEKILLEINTTKPIDLTLLFGTLAWFSMYQDEVSNAYLDAERIIKWSRNMIMTREVADQLMNAANDAKILKCSGGVAGWGDKLVADGCAALYLAEELDDPDVSDATIAEDVKRLERKNSVDILALVLDPALVLRVITCCTASSPSSAAAIQRIVTDDFIARLAEIPETLTELGQRLLDFGSKIKIEHIADVAAALGRVASVSAKVTDLCDNVIQQALPAAEIALAAKAISSNASYGFFKSALPAYLHPVAADAAARVWNLDGFNPLKERLSELAASGHGTNRLTGIWQTWCQRQNPMSLLKCILSMLDEILANTENHTFIVQLIEASLESLFNTVSPATRREIQSDIRKLWHYVNRIVPTSNVGVISSLLKWLTYDICPNAIRQDSTWMIINEEGVCAIQRKPNSPARIEHIFAQLSTLGSQYSLPATRELMHLDLPPDGEWEIVRDFLPNGFRYDKRTILTGQLAVAGNHKGKFEPRSFDRSKEHHSLFFWRPRVSIA